MNKLFNKYIWVFFIVLLIALPTLIAANFNSLKSPEKLIVKPVSNESNLQIYNSIRRLTPLDTSFTMPQNFKEVSKINRVDLDSDGIEDIVAFKKKNNENQGTSNIYMYIFNMQSGQISEDDESIVRIPGETIKYANFIDLDNDGKKEIILHINSLGYENIYVYSYEDGNIKKKAEYNSSETSIKLNFFDYDNDGHMECLALIQSQKNYEVSICGMRLENNNIQFDKYDTSYTVESLDKVEILNGRLSNKYLGSVITYQSLRGSSVNQLIIYRNSRFEKVIKNESNIAINPYNLRAEDMNGDGILDLPKIEEGLTNSSTKDNIIISWYDWNGKLEEKKEVLTRIGQNFYSFTYNFKQVIPDILRDKIYIKVENKDNKDEYSIYYINDKSKVELLTYTVIPKASANYENIDKEDVKTRVLFETEDYVCILKKSNETMLKKYGINLNRISKTFVLINK
ncbi:MAG: VCBS repeat-containing protein [Peptostreptococcus sp.]|uniref:FG-GAP repeat domain-containing protein n=1 Tax=Peptostreptococcus sp. TaxID=1262 RepID=UPI001CAD908A|nr:VCBS repeat-containing protein [Peptostreptococcus sp.]MBF1057518.1 VCBS repeat-containing protein [Peptostreptococcus sp.]